MSNRRTVSQLATEFVNRIPEVMYSREFSREYEELGLCRESNSRPTSRVRKNSLYDAITELTEDGAYGND
jgi:hypothetical protein